ncbi:hypothetical protein GA0111570_103213 [Raineyella antarctica]|uniref:Uncharacterized protein n=1 Tax=Raineyella antarctica TaxID=1577474 RepID=A0A1G6GGU2_9ACTN|nr:hypothetical protein [Raineyella antarctica]SDB81109.1 hypothetical protein GA0111570_103213 [Raineyella antarctica]
MSLTAIGLNGNLAGAARLRDISIELAAEVPTVVIASEERPRRALLRLLSGACSITSGELVFREGDQEVDLAQTSALDLATVRNRGIACSVTVPAPHPTLTCAQAVAELAHCPLEEAETELAALGHGHAVAVKVGDTRGSDRSVIPIAASLLHAARIILVDLTNHPAPEVRQRVLARARRGAAVLIVTDALYDDLPSTARSHLLTPDGHLV